MSHDIFISYAKNDAEVANAVCRGLEYAGIQCWIAPRNIMTGQRWADSIAQAISNSKIIVVIFSSSSNNSTYVLNEVTAALDAGLIIMLYRIQDVPLSGEMKIHVGGVQWFDALTPPVENHLAGLIQATRHTIAGKPFPSHTISQVYLNYDDKTIGDRKTDLTIRTNMFVRAIRFVGWCPVVIICIYGLCSSEGPKLFTKYNLDPQYMQIYPVVLSVVVSIIYIYIGVGIMLGRRNELSIREDRIILRCGYGIFDINYVEIAEWSRGILTHLGVKTGFLSMMFNSGTIILHSSDRDTIELPDMRDSFIFRSFANRYLKVNQRRPEVIIRSSYFVRPVLWVIEVIFSLIGMGLFFAALGTVWEMISKGILGNAIPETYGILALTFFAILIVAGICGAIGGKIEDYRKKISY
jgi:TIR domain